MAERVLQTDWKCIGRSGSTVDGRVISPQVIEDMAASYDKELYTALIWPEHNRWFNMGQIVQLRSQANSEGGKDLYAIISPNDYYLAANSAGQKLFSSMEITLDFRKTGKAYLTGMGATDDPASVATSEIRLSKAASAGGVMLTPTVEMTTQQFNDPVKLSFAERFYDLFTHKQGDDMADKAAFDKLSVELAELKALFLTPAPANADDAPKPEDQFKKLNERLDAFEQQFAAFSKKPEAAADDDKLKPLLARIEAFGAKLEEALKEQPGTKTPEHFAGGDDDKKDIY